MRLHDLRHGTAKLLLAKGATQPEIMAVLGQTNISTTMNIYAPVAPEFMRQHADRLLRALGE